MKRIYLDQMHWINLSAAALSLPKGEPYEDALLLARAGVQRGALSFPLSVAHYQETANRRDWQSRRDLAAIMGELSRYHTIASQNALIEAEIERGLEHFFGVDLGAPAPQPFGQGAAHASGRPLREWSLPDDLKDLLPDSAIWNVQQQFKEQIEPIMLSGLSPQHEAQVKAKTPSWDPTAHIAVAKTAAEEQERARGRRRAAGFNKGTNAKNYFAFEAYQDWLPVLNDALKKAHMPSETLLQLGVDGMSKFLEFIPTLWVAAEFRRHRSVASQAVLVGNDLLDQLALPQAVVYCDIVVTERQHATAFRTLGFGERHHTVPLNDLRDLPAHLV